MKSLNLNYICFIIHKHNYLILYLILKFNNSLVYYPLLSIIDDREIEYLAELLNSYIKKKSSIL